MKQAELVYDGKAILAEGPVWDDRESMLYWIDIHGKAIHIYNPESKRDQIIHTGQKIGAISLMEKEGLIAAMENGLYKIDLQTEEKSFITDPEKEKPDNRFNDGKCDPKGRFLAGTMQKEGQGTTGALYSLDEHQNVRKLLDEAGISNGLAWNQSGDTFYYIDTPTQKVAAFDYDLASGNLSNKRTVIEIPEEEGHPDGMTIDAEGNLWIAHFNGSRVSRWNPDTGEKLEEVHLPVSQVTCCTFGGKDLDELYITTGRENLEGEELAKQPLAGAIFKYKTDTKGVKSNRYKG
ncbi:SMP-30/gluconolactonase/LRE family protein [Bacillus sp. FJAT-42376]|uniref:SMP-30/gluconolactonase/LRE family protein n=1 Tax=Bacillus sp. FJAT-42376 TaxID=2014076 RepID=UPI000F4EAE64|nr:SMP-30/gluconolactonase/LRE family protein [Bacillus sp. FJAT-42376]AZB44145.1 SMP-30/gluconolactonase/LRE family protein [Bacillus sp. FJAT-42376]